jgi:hypothetical protein
MRDYKFRGKRRDNGEWVTGYFWLMNDERNGNKACITVSNVGADDFFNYEVIPETVGQYSTIQDQATKDIYEGDVIKVAGRLLRVIFDAGCFLSIWGQNRYRLNQWGSEGVEVIGNIHDNPELLNQPQRSGLLNTMLDPNIKTEQAPTETEQEQVPGEATQESAQTEE